MPIRVVAIEDHPLMLKAILQELNAQPDIHVVETATHGSELYRLLREASPDVIVLDLGMSTGGFEPITAVKAVRQTHPNVQILVLTGYDDGVWMRELIAAGARGYVFKSDDLSLNLPEGVREVYQGRRFYSPAVLDKLLTHDDASLLTGQDLVLLRMSSQGFTNVHIGQELGLSERTIRNRFSAIYRKLGIEADNDINPRMAAVNVARDLGLLEEDRH